MFCSFAQRTSSHGDLLSRWCALNSFSGNFWLHCRHRSHFIGFSAGSPAGLGGVRCSNILGGRRAHEATRGRKMKTVKRTAGGLAIDYPYGNDEVFTREPNASVFDDRYHIIYRVYRVYIPEILSFYMCRNLQACGESVEEVGAAGRVSHRSVRTHGHLVRLYC